MIVDMLSDKKTSIDSNRAPSQKDGMETAISLVFIT